MPGLIPQKRTRRSGPTRSAGHLAWSKNVSGGRSSGPRCSSDRCLRFRRPPIRRSTQGSRRGRNRCGNACRRNVLWTWLCDLCAGVLDLIHARTIVLDSQQLESLLDLGLPRHVGAVRSNAFWEPTEAGPALIVPRGETISASSVAVAGRALVVVPGPIRSLAGNRRMHR